MLVRRVLAAAGVAALLAAVPVVPSFAADPVTDLYVATGGSDTNDCSQAAPCATVNQAVFDADPTGTTIHVGAGTFDGPVRPGVFGRSVIIQGVSRADTTLTASEGTQGWDGTVVELYGATDSSMSELTVTGTLGGTISVIDADVSLHLDHVAVTGGGCALYVSAGAVDAIDSTFSGGGSGGSGGCGPVPGGLAGDVVNDGGNVTLTRAQVLEPAAGDVGVGSTGGTTTVDQSNFDATANQSDLNNSTGVRATGGTVTVTRSTVTGFGAGLVGKGATTDVRDSTFVGNVVGVDGQSGSTTVVRSTFQDELASLQGTVSVAGSVLGTDAIKNCNGTIADLGYNLATDDSCGFTATTSQELVVPGLDAGLSDLGGPVRTVALRNPSEAVDLIPVGATYGDTDAPLCPVNGATDLRGVPRPAGAGCDAGSMELAGTVTTLAAPATAAPHAEVDLEATVDVPDVGLAGIAGDRDGVVTFRAGAQVLCDAVPVVLGKAACVTTALGAGSRSVTATFSPAAGSIVDTSTSPVYLVLVGTAPGITGPGRTVLRVGKPASITLRAAGQPVPTLALTKGKLPAGLKLTRTAGKVTLAGKAKASAVGRHVLTFRATNLMGQVGHTLTIVVKRS